MMNRILWPLLRFSLCAWVGGAVLFVITGVRELSTAEFDAPTKNLLVLLRFPAYYWCGASLTLTGGLSAALLARTSGPHRKRLLTIAILCATSLAVMAIDRLCIYSPLEQMMTRPDRTIDPKFWAWHRMSKYINMLTIGSVLLAGILAVQEPRSSPETEGKST